MMRRSVLFLAALCIASLPAVAQSDQGPVLADRLLRFAGRMHPVLVHFPIALIAVAAVIEVGRGAARRPTPARTSLIMLAFAVAGAGAAAFSGWINGDYENHTSVAETMELHRWVAIGASSAAALALLIGLGAGSRRGLVMAFRAILVVAAGATCFAGHLGGVMVYGEDYFIAPLRSSSSAPAASEPSSPILSANPMVGGVSFERDVLPIFQARCVECHGAGRTRGGLRLDSLAHAIAADEWIIAPGDPDGSDLIARIELPASEDGAMPPKGERLTEGQIVAIRAWIASLEDAAGPGDEPAPSDEAPTTPDA